MILIRNIIQVILIIQIIIIQVILIILIHIQVILIIQIIIQAILIIVNPLALNHQIRMKIIVEKIKNHPKKND